MSAAEKLSEQITETNRSGYKVPLTTILEVIPHGNADSLAVYRVYGFEVIGGLNQYKVGDQVIYVPIDSILPKEIEEKLFPADSKVKLHNSRIRQIKLRGRASQGLLISPDKLGILNGKLEKDYAEQLGITKYIPPELIPKEGRIQGQKRDKPLTNAKFHQYNGCENVKWYPELFKEGEPVAIQEKLHGSNIRFGYLPVAVNTLKKRILRFFGMLPAYEYCYGSNQRELTNVSGDRGYYGTDVYGAAIKRIDGFSKLKKNEIVYGELIGQGIQKNYSYGHAEHHVVIFDVKILQDDGVTYKWLTPKEVQVFAKERGFDMVPLLHYGAFSKEKAYALTKGKSEYCKQQPVREGIVIKAMIDYNDGLMPSGRKALKWINEDYLNDNSNTDIQ